MSDTNRDRRKSGEPNSVAEKPNSVVEKSNAVAEKHKKSVMGTSREPSVTFSLQNEQIAFDEEHSGRSQNPIRRTTSTPRNGSIIDEMSSAYPHHARRNSRTSNMMRGSMSNINELAPGPIVMYNPHMPQDHMMYNPHIPPMMSRAPSVSQLWIPQPPPMSQFGSGQFGHGQFAPYYYGPPTHQYPPVPLNPKDMKKAMKNARKLEKKRQLEEDIAMDRVGCGFYCCDGVAQLLWLIIAITLLGFVAALILALYVV